MVTRKLTAWLAHCYTALGLVAAAGMAVFIVRGAAESFRRAIALMIVATIIDSTDGWLARRARVKEILPRFDGSRLDDIIDFQTYTSLPLLFIWRAGILPPDLSWWLLTALLASVYGFSQSDSKTSGANTSGAKSAHSGRSEEHFFVGFPSYWNVVAIYLYWLRPPVWLALALIIAFALLTFVPSLYLYTSRGGRLSRLTNILCAVWGVLLALIVAGVFDNPKPFVWASLALPIYYFVVSWAITLERWFGGRGRTKSNQQALAQNQPRGARGSRGKAIQMSPRVPRAPRG
ncbi:MAG TPA: CDP-alcohol phosphatidyltransferase [Blastocatellia bacterium]|nr:CDP-alcohol phosphatidyltransferase [Blastocatellia bacterium]